MTAFLTDFWRAMTVRESITAAVDIAVVFYVIYRVLLMLKGTRAAQMLVGLLLVTAGFFAAKLFDLTTLSWLLDNLINYAIIFLIVIFQHDIRRGLTRVGQNLFAHGRQYEETFVFEEIIKAAETMARGRVGALIVLERDADLEEFFGDPGVVVDARVTKELLVATFIPEPDNTLHDGAVVVKNLRVHRAGCVLPLSANPRLAKELGTRHRAAIGITEETDAVVVVVSEERGSISICFGGNIARDLDAATLRKALLGLFHKEKRRFRSRARPAAPRSDPMEKTQRLFVADLARAAAEEAAAADAAAAAPERVKEAAAPEEHLPAGTVTQPMAVVTAARPVAAGGATPAPDAAATARADRGDEG